MGNVPGGFHPTGIHGYSTKQSLQIYTKENITQKKEKCDSALAE